MEIKWEDVIVPHYIYILHDPSQITNNVYIGKTINPAGRYQEHLRYTPTMQRKSNWVMDVAKSGTKIQLLILEEIDENDGDAENYWIEYFKYIGANVLNK